MSARPMNVIRTATRCACAVGLAAALASAFATPAGAQSKTGTTMGQFLLIEPSARLTALGNAGVSEGTGLDAVYYNPAAIARATGMEFAFSHVAWLADIRFDYVGAAFPFAGWGTGFATITSLSSGEIDVRTVAQPLGTGERFTVSNLALGLGFARAVTERFSAGAQVRWVQETVWHTSANTVTFDIGTVYRLRPNGLHIGSSLTNFGTESGYSGRDLRITYDGDPSRQGDNNALPGERFVQDYPVPVAFRVGAGMPFQLSAMWRLWTVAEAVHPNDNSESANLGVEAGYHEAIALRAGYQSLFQQDSEEGLTLGAGIKGRLENFDYRVDYAWADEGRLGGVHRFSLTLNY
jgi:hypothetical protein